MSIAGPLNAAPPGHASDDRKTFFLTLTRRNRSGIVAAVSTSLFEAGGDIEEAQQFDDHGSGRFFMRVHFSGDASGPDADSLRVRLAPIVERFGLTSDLRSPLTLRRILILASKLDHCLADLLDRWRIGELPIIVSGIVSNHPRETFANVDFGRS